MKKQAIYVMDSASASLGCPWCGSNDLRWDFAELERDDAWYFIQCKNCEGHGPWSGFTHETDESDMRNAYTNAWLFWQIRGGRSLKWPWSVAPDEPLTRKVPGAEPCPFCGLETLYLDQIMGTLISCQICGASGPESNREWTDEQKDKYDEEEAPLEEDIARRLWNSRKKT